LLQLLPGTTLSRIFECNHWLPQWIQVNKQVFKEVKLYLWIVVLFLPLHREELVFGVFNLHRLILHKIPIMNSIIEFTLFGNKPTLWFTSEFKLTHLEFLSVDNLYMEHNVSWVSCLLEAVPMTNYYCHIIGDVHNLSDGGRGAGGDDINFSIKSLCLVLNDTCSII